MTSAVQQLNDAALQVGGPLPKLQRKTLVARHHWRRAQPRHRHDDDRREGRHHQLVHVADAAAPLLGPRLDDCVVRQVNAKILYGFEYQGACSRLVITPLTDRCWMTITGGLHVKLGSAARGPRGHRQDRVDQGSCQGHRRAVRRVQLLRSARLQDDGQALLGRRAVRLLDVPRRVQPHRHRGALGRGAAAAHHPAGAPAGGGDASPSRGARSRSRHLRRLHHHEPWLRRPHRAARQPQGAVPPGLHDGARLRTDRRDHALRRGLPRLAQLAQKMVKMYKLCSEQLSQQDHYDYGMRQVKSVLVMAGEQKRANPELHENISLIRAMLEANIPRFLADDLPLFHGIIGDLYPNLEIPPVDYGALKIACEDALARAGLQVVAALRRQDHRALPDDERALWRDDRRPDRAAASRAASARCRGAWRRSRRPTTTTLRWRRTSRRTSSTPNALPWARCVIHATRRKKLSPHDVNPRVPITSIDCRHPMTCKSCARPVRNSGWLLPNRARARAATLLADLPSDSHSRVACPCPLFSCFAALRRVQRADAGVDRRHRLDLHPAGCRPDRPTRTTSSGWSSTAPSTPSGSRT